MINPQTNFYLDFGELPLPLKQPVVSSQAALVLNLIREHQPLLSFELTAAAARVHDMHASDWNILTIIHAKVKFREVECRKVAAYSQGVPEWVPPVRSL